MDYDPSDQVKRDVGRAYVLVNPSTATASSIRRQRTRYGKTATPSTAHSDSTRTR
jgi:hypothetical protein